MKLKVARRVTRTLAQSREAPSPEHPFAKAAREIVL
jgi:hypothetical protein